MPVYLEPRLGDAAIHERIIEELASDPRISAGAIGVAVDEGVVTLSGTVSSLPEKWSAQSAVKRIKGVRAVACEIVVNTLDAHQRNDTDIAAAAAHVLAWHPLIFDDVQVVVESSAVTLSGAVDWHYQRVEAEMAVANLIGVREVQNQIAIKEHNRPVDIYEDILRNLARTAHLHPNDVQLDVERGVVTLAGAVTSWNLYDAAERAAWSVAGVRAVNNLIAVTPY